jgi:hypothetical protein
MAEKNDESVQETACGERACEECRKRFFGFACDGPGRPPRTGAPSPRRDEDEDDREAR